MRVGVLSCIPKLFLNYFSRRSNHCHCLLTAASKKPALFAARYRAVAFILGKGDSKIDISAEVPSGRIINWIDF
jgi:hypothetical protein